MPEATPAQLAQVIHGHWAIENRVHHVKDTTYDWGYLPLAGRIAARSALAMPPGVMATCETSPSAIIRARHGGNVAARIRALDRKVTDLLVLLYHNPSHTVTPTTSVTEVST